MGPAARATAALVAVVALAACGGPATKPPSRGGPPSSPVVTGANPTPSTTAPTTASPPGPTDEAAATDETTVTVTVVGDVMLGRRVERSAAERGDPVAPLRPMAAQLAAADLTVGNLESTLARSGPPRQGNDSFAAPPEAAAGLAEVGFDVLSLANNHSGDFGREALVRTVRRLRAAGIAPLGAGADEATAWRPVVVEREGIRIGLAAFNAIGETFRAGPGSPGAASLSMRPRTGAIDPAELARLQQRIRDLSARTDVVIVLPHWGDQYTHRPVRDQRLVGRALIEAGATVVVGAHPHWVQDIQRHRGRFVVHSLGNFVFDMDFMPQTQEGVALTMTFRAGALVGARLLPYVIGPDFAPRPVTGARAAAILSDIRGRHLLP